uniref:ZP domain-containing protein n=1 Tax=Ascaris lumbricoides TaxID=6252 RepID=A0A0M3HMX3_ASCLU
MSATFCGQQFNGLGAVRMERRKSESVEHMCFFNSFKRLSASCANECCSRHNWRVTRPIAPCCNGFIFLNVFSAKLLIFTTLLVSIVAWLLAVANSTSIPSDDDTSTTTTLLSSTTEETSTETAQSTVNTSQSATTVNLSTTTAPQQAHSSFSGGTFFGGIVLGMALMTLLYGVYAIWVKRRSVQSEYNAY